MNFSRLVFSCLLALAGEVFAQPVLPPATSGVESPQGALLRLSDGSFYGTSAAGGTGAYGTIYRITPESEITVLVNFTGDDGTAKGAYPRAGLTADGAGLPWGTTEQGGASGLGTVFKFDPATGAFTTVLEFAGPNGSNPDGALVADGAGAMWGTAREGGANNLGTVFRINTTTGVLESVVEFTGTNGAAVGSRPKAGLWLDGAGLMWGTTSTGGAGDLGTIFSINTADDTFTSKVVFTGTSQSALGSAPVAALIGGPGGSIWGTTSAGGTHDLGTVFSFNPTSGNVTTIVNFDGSNGSRPKAALVVESGIFWGVTYDGGAADTGTIFKIDPANSNAVTLVSSFLGTTGTARGAYPVAPLAHGLAGELWGTATQGGREERGTIIRVLTATGDVLLVAEPEVKPILPNSTVQMPPATATTGAAGTPITLRGSAKDNIELLSVIVSINGGPFLPATLIPPTGPGKPYTWQLDVIPENGVNVVIIKSVDNGGNPAKPIRLVFNYTVVRPEVAGSYTGVLTPAVASTTPLLHSGAFKLKVTPKGRFTGTLSLGGLPKPVVLTGSFGNAGTARFGKTGTTTLTIVRKALAPLIFALNLDVDAPYSRQLTGTLRESNVTVGNATGGQLIYTNKKNPVAPLIPVPTPLLDPASDKGAYTALFRALTPTAQGLPADKFPQGDGYAVFKIASTGAVKMSGKLADGSPFLAANSLTADNQLPFFVKLYTGKGAMVGLITFQNLGGSDADAEMEWFRPVNTKAGSYRDGWLTGIGIDFAASRFVTTAISGQTALGNTPSTGGANALAKLAGGNLPGELGNLLSLPASGVTVDLGAAVASTAASGLKLSLGKTGVITGSFTHPGQTLPVAFSGAALQKSQTGGGYFIAPAVGAVAGDPKQSGHLDLSAQ